MARTTGNTPSVNPKVVFRWWAEPRGYPSKKTMSAYLNAAAAMFVTGKYESIVAAVKTACDVIDSGKAYEKLAGFIRFSNE